MTTLTPDVRAAQQGRVFQQLIDGELVEAASGERIDSIDPFTGRAWASVPAGGPQDVELAVAAARRAFTEGPWGRLPGRDRARLMRRLAELIEQRADQLSIVETLDNGKLLREMSGQMSGLAEWYFYYAGMADKLHGETVADTNPYFKYTRREPVGVVAAITPWNSPLLLLSFKLAPALAAGCTVVVKPAEQASASTLAFAELIAEAGFPDGTVNVINGDGPQVGAPLTADRRVDHIAFTGSTATGIAVAHSAADHLASVSLELGGKSANIVFADAFRADPQAVVNGVLAGIFAATGQTCVAGSRLLVEASVRDELTAALVARASRLRLGDPLLGETEVGPVAFADHREHVLTCIDSGVQAGARVVLGGGRPEEAGLVDGYFVQPTILTDVDTAMDIAQQEVFGPVLAVLSFADEAEALTIANDTQYGLAAGVWTNDIRRAHRVAHHLESGTVWINSYRALSYDMPFAGRKLSGLGVENGLDTLREYTQPKAVWVELSGATRDPFSLG